MCSRQERIQKDVDVVIQQCKADGESPFSDFRYADSTFTFKYSQASNGVTYFVNVSDDYPDNTCVSNSENADDVLFTSDPVPVIFHRIAAEMKLKDHAGETYQCRDAPGDSDGGDDTDVDLPEEHSDNEFHRSPQLEADLQAVRDLKYAVFLHEYVDEVDIDLHVHVGFLDEETALAWAVDRHEPVTMRLSCSLTQYLKGTVPKVDVFQVSKLKDRFGLGHQLKNIMQTFVTEMWEQEHKGEAPWLATSASVKCNFNHSYHDSVLTSGQSHSYNPVKSVPTRNRGFLVQVIEYAEQRIPLLNEYCVICDELHVFINGPMLRPYVCERELCIFAFQTLGVMNKVTDVIATGALVVDLLVSMARAAVSSNRRDVIFDPYPSVVDPDDPQRLALDPNNKNYERVLKAIDNLPPITELLKTPHAEMKEKMNKVDKLAVPLLQWVISSNRSYISKLPANKQLDFMHTPHQFLLLCSAPAKENAFREARRIHGSTFVFHGSNIENWHSILRRGLVIASNTKFQLHGNSEGNGIYLSPSSNIPFSFSGIGMGYGMGMMNRQATEDTKTTARTTEKKELQFIRSRNLKCIAVCEVITSSAVNKHGGDIWVCSNADHVCTRFFCIYEEGQGKDPNINTQTTPGIYQKILNVVNSRHLATKE